MLKQFRHAIREYQIAFPRGFAEKNLSPEENLRTEIKEELGADLLDCEFLGKINPDSGITSNAVDIYLCNITKPEIIFGNEGISRYILHTADELREKIKAGEITDSFTLSAFALLSARQTLT